MQASCELVGAQLVWQVVIQHELANDPAEADEGDECEGRDPLRLDCRKQRLQRCVAGHVPDDDRLRVESLGRPGCVPLDGRAVLGGEPAKGLEPHDAVGVEQ